MTANRIYTPEEKLKIVLEGMSGTISVADLCRKYDLKPARFYYWKEHNFLRLFLQVPHRSRQIYEYEIFINEPLRMM